MSVQRVDRKWPAHGQSDAIDPEQTFGPSPGPFSVVLAVIKLTE